MKKVFITLVSLALLVVFLYPLFLSGKEIGTASHEKAISIEYHIFPVGDEGWGYEISSRDKILIKQSQIPAVEGNESFKTKKDAENVAKLVLNKIKMNETPNITKEELRQLKIIE